MGSFARFTNFLLMHRWLTVALVFAITFVPVIGTLGILIAALVTLHKGVIEGGILALAATLPFVSSLYVTGSHDLASLPISVWTVFGLAVLSNLLTWIFSVMLRMRASWSRMLQIVTLACVLGVSVVHLLYPDVASWWGQQLQASLSQAQQMAGVLKPNAVKANAAQLDAINTYKEFATGALVAVALLVAILQIISVRLWEVIVYKNGSLRLPLQGIRLSQLAGILFFLSLVFSYFGNLVVLDIMPILYILFGAAGLSLIHYFFGMMGNAPSKWVWMTVLYLVIIIGMPTSIVFVSMLAWLDIWLDIRKRFRKI